MNITPLAKITPLESIDNIKLKALGTGETDNNGSAESFEDTLKNAINGVKEIETKSNQDSYDLAMGKTDDLESIMIQSAKATAAIEVTTQIVTRAVNSYKEITQMQI